MFDVVIVVATFTTLGFVVRQFSRLMSTWMLHKTIRTALKSHPESVSELAAKLHSHSTREHPMFGWAAIALAAAIALLSIFQQASERLELLQLAALPLFVGVATLAYLRLSRYREEPSSVGDR